MSRFNRLDLPLSIAGLASFALAASLMLAAAPALAQSGESDTGAAGEASAGEGALPAVETLSDETVVGRVGEREITHADVLVAAEQLGPQWIQNLSQVYPVIVQRLIDLELVTQAALEAGLDDEPRLQERMEEARIAVLRDYFLERKLEDAVTEEAIAARYEAYKEANPPQAEIKARHILLEDKAAAKAVIAELDGGAHFAELAKERSTGPSGANGGDLGYFTAEMMVPDFSEAAFELEPGSYSKTPVETQFGWHVILVEDQRDTKQPTLEALREELTRELQQETVQGLLEDLRSSGDVVNLRAPAEEATQN